MAEFTDAHLIIKEPATGPGTPSLPSGGSKWVCAKENENPPTETNNIDTMCLRYIDTGFFFDENRN